MYYIYLLVIRDVYAFSKSASVYDNPPEVHLDLMCHGLWKRLSHARTLRRALKQSTRRFRVGLQLNERGELPCLSKPSPNVFCDTARYRGRKLFPDMADVLKIL